MPNRLTLESTDEAVKQAGLLLVRRSQINREERIGTLRRAKALRDLLLDLGHPERLLVQFVHKRDIVLGHETPDVTV